MSYLPIPGKPGPGQLMPSAPSQQLFLSASTALFAKYIEKLPPAVTPILQTPLVLQPDPQQSELERLTSLVTTLDEQLGRLSGENRELQAQLETSTSHGRNLEQRLHSLENENGQLQGNIDLISDLLKNALDPEPLERMQSEHAQSKAELEGRCAHLAGELADTRAQLQRASLSSSDQQDAMRSQLQAQETQIQSLSQQLLENSAQRHALQERCQQLASEVEELRPQLAAARNDYQQLTHTVSAERASIAQRESELATATALSDLNASEAGLTILGLNTELQQLRTDLQQTRTLLATAQATAAQMPQFEQLQREHQELQARYASLLQSNQSLESMAQQQQQQHLHNAISHVSSASAELKFAMENAHIPPPPPLPPPPLQSCASPFRRTASSSDTVISADALQAARREMNKDKPAKLQSWERPYFWKDYGPEAIDPFVKAWIESPTPAQDFQTKARIGNWAIEMLFILEKCEKGATRFCWRLESLPALMTTAEAKKHWDEAFLSQVSASQGSSSSSSAPADSDDDWGEEDTQEDTRQVSPDLMQSMFIPSSGSHGTSFYGSGVITKTALIERFAQKVQQIQNSIRFATDVANRASLGKFSALGRANGR